MVSFIVFVVGIFILVSTVFITLILSIIQFVLNFIIANILPISLILFGLLTLSIILAIFLPEPEQKKKENNSQNSTAQADTRGNTVSEKEQSKKNTINVKSTVVKEQANSDKNYNKKTYQASTEYSTKEKSSSNTVNKYSNKNSFKTQTSVLFERNVETENHCETEKKQIYYYGFSEVIFELNRLKLSSFQSRIQSGETIQFQLTGFDIFNNPIEINERISWSATAGKIYPTGLFSIYSKDDVLVTITAQVGSLKTIATVNVESTYELIETLQLKSLRVVPDCISLKPGEEQVFEALGFDQYDNSIDCDEIIWSATGGTIDQNGKGANHFCQNKSIN